MAKKKSLPPEDDDVPEGNVDEDGDEIANGVYPYKLIIKNGKESKEKIEKLVVLK